MAVAASALALLLTGRVDAAPVQVRLPCHPRRRLFDWPPSAGGTVLYVRCRDCGQDWAVRLQPAENGRGC